VKGTSYSKVPTGIEGLDSMLEGGLPKGRIILIRGSPGAGKSILCSHYLFNGATKFGEKGIYVSLEESKHQLFREMQLFDMDFKSLEDENQVAFIDASPIRHTPAEKKLGNIRG
jgi:circadian clock protein KaiC